MLELPNLGHMNMPIYNLKMDSLGILTWLTPSKKNLYPKISSCFFLKKKTKRFFRKKIFFHIHLKESKKYLIITRKKQFSKQKISYICLENTNSLYLKKKVKLLHFRCILVTALLFLCQQTNNGTNQKHQSSPCL